MGVFLYCYIVERVLLDILYLGDISWEIYLYLNINKNGINFYALFYIAEILAFSKAICFLIYCIGCLFNFLRPSDKILLVKGCIFIISIINFFFIMFGLKQEGNLFMFVVPFIGAFFIFISLMSQTKYNDTIDGLSKDKAPLTDNQNTNNDMTTKLYPDDTMNQKPVDNEYNANTITVESTSEDKHNNDNIPPPAFIN